MILFSILSLRLTRPATFRVYIVGGYVGKLGTNSTREPYAGCTYGRHAEMDVLTKYDKLKSKSKRVPADIIIIRINRSGEMTNSKPCAKCIKYMASSKCKIRYIYYSIDATTILRTTIAELDSQPKHISWRFQEKRNRKPQN